MMDRELSVYSATNTADHRFDVVRAVILDDCIAPTVASELSAERESLRNLLISLRGVRPDQARVQVANAVGHQTAAEILEDLEHYIEREGLDADDTSPEEESVSIGGGRLITFGDPTDEYSWFPGYSWTVGTCGNCGQHMGWVFYDKLEESEDWSRKFVSLIVTNLREKYIPGEDSVEPLQN